MPNTYELATALAPAFAWLETCEDAHEANPTQESAQALADAQADIDALFDAAPDKAAAVWYMADRYDAEAAFAKAEAKAWSERSKRKADRAAKLRDSLVLLIDQWTETTGEPEEGGASSEGAGQGAADDGAIPEEGAETAPPPAESGGAETPAPAENP